jgi:1-phosphofructokinase family hexose kinase
VIATVTVNPAFDKLCYVDDFSAGEVHRISRETQERTVIGGKGVNVSVFLRTFGLDSIAMGFSGGLHGTLLELDLRDLGVTTNFVRTEHETRTNLFFIDKKNDRLTVVNVSGSAIGSEDLQLFEDRFQKVLNQIDTLVLSGSLLPDMDVNFYGNLVERAHAKGVRVLVNTSPRYFESVVRVGGFALFPDLRSGGDFYGQTLADAHDCLACGRTLLKECATCEVVVFSHLIGEIITITREDSRIFRRRDLHPANLLGFADAVVAGLLYGLEGGHSLPEALAWGSAAGFAVGEQETKFDLTLKHVEEALSLLEVEEIEP